jgi:hypothetical protein
MLKYILHAVRQTNPLGKLGYQMKVTCQGCCINYGSGESFSRLKCGIKGSCTDFVPIFLVSEAGHPPYEDDSFFTLYPNSPPIKPASLFRVGGLLNDQISTTHTFLDGFDGAFALKGFLQFSTGSAVLRSENIELTSTGLLESATITARKQ